MVSIIQTSAVANFDYYGSLWGYITVAEAETYIDEARANGADIDEWNVTDREGFPIRIVRTTDPDDTFFGGIDISVFPAECNACDSP